MNAAAVGEEDVASFILLFPPPWSCPSGFREGVMTAILAM